MTSLESEALRQLWAQRVAAFYASGLSGAQWCAQEHLSADQLSYWKRKFARSEATASAATWLPVPLTPESPDPCLGVRVGGAVIEVQTGFAPELLRAIVEALS